MLFFSSMPAGGPSEGEPAATTLIDAHAHLWGGFDVARFLAGAAQNFADARGGRPGHAGPSPSPGLLLVHEDGGPGLARRLAGSTGDWSIESREGACIARHPRRGSVVLVAGRQAVSREGLEVLTAPDTEPPGEGTLEVLVDRAHERGICPILPWGLGKWTGARGTVIDRLLESRDPARILVADNGGRPFQRHRPALLVQAERRGFRVIRGSDPLPLRGEERRAGAYGSSAPVSIDLADPAASVLELLSDDGFFWSSYGAGLGLARVIWNQIRLRAGGRIA